MSPYVAGLPMYDWPEVRDEVDALWTAISIRLCDAGIKAPTRLWRTEHKVDLWDHPELLVGECCGLNVVTTHHGRVEVLGALDRGIEGCGPGEYRSVLVCRAADPAADLTAFRGRPVAINGPNSQSGNGVLITGVAPLASAGRFFGEIVETGSHRASVRAVAEGRADLAAIDAASWRLALDHDPATDDLRVFARTDPMPAPPLVIGWAHAHLRNAAVAAIGAAVASLSPDVRRPLDLYGFVERTTGDYQVLADLIDLAAAAGYPTVA